MGTSFDCAVVVSAHPHSGQMVLGIGPFDMANLVELLDWLASQEGRDKLLDHAAQAFLGSNHDERTI